MDHRGGAAVECHMNSVHVDHNSELVKACFENLKKAISTLYSENSKADTDGQIDMMPLLRQCAKMEYALDGDIKNLIHMNNEDRQAAGLKGDKILDFASNVSTLGDYAVAEPAMTKYAEGQREKNALMMKLVVARGRVEGAKELLEQLKAEMQTVTN